MYTVILEFVKKLDISTTGQNITNEGSLQL